MTTELPKRRQSFQFRLRTVLTAVLVVSLPLSWFAVEMNSARKQRKAVEAIEEAGGRVAYEPARPSAPDWMCRIVGDDFFIDVVSVSSEFSGFTDSTSARLDNLPNVRLLYILGSEITDIGLEHLKRLTNLERLYFDGTGITDAGLEHLSGMIRLEDLGIGSSQGTNAVIELYEGLVDRETLDPIVAEQERDVGLEQLEDLRERIEADCDAAFEDLLNNLTDENLELFKEKTRRLENPSITNPHVTDAGLEHLKGLPNLDTLYFDSTQVTDAGLEHLKDLAKLRRLYLNGTGITDVGLDHLKGLTSLRELHLDGAQVTPKGVANLRQALPNCTVDLASWRDIW